MTMQSARSAAAQKERTKEINVIILDMPFPAAAGDKPLAAYTFGADGTIKFATVAFFFKRNWSADILRPFAAHFTA